ncbi:MAG TPA: hypothetical protein VL860_12905 [Planctomycetota bacterium]|nr:hypothetical protein [Planctomycetota bacterium]
MARKQRETVLASYAKDLDAARARGLAGIEKWLDWSIDNGLSGNTVDLYRTVVHAYPGRVWPEKLKNAYAAPTPPGTDKASLSGCQTRRDNALQGYGIELMSLVRACASVRMYDKAYELLQEILRVSPDDRNARNYLGYLPVIDPDTHQRLWLWKADAAHVSRGEVWIGDIGWVPRNQADRYRKGEYLDGGKWIALAEANRRHADADNPWVIAGPHFILRTTLEHADALDLSVALEEYYRTVYKDFLGFFAQDNRALNAMFDSGVATTPLVVNFFATKDQYDNCVRTKMAKARNVELLIKSGGFYSHATGESYFYKTPSRQVDLQVAFHETTHQILGEFIRETKTTARVAEMPAVYMEYVRWQNGRILTPPWALSDFLRAMRLDKEVMTVAAYTALTEDQFQCSDESARLLHYAMAGGLADFLMNADNGVYRQGFMEFCRDSYKKGEIPPLNEYLGLNAADLEAGWKSYREKNFVGIMGRIKALARQWREQHPQQEPGTEFSPVTSAPTSPNETAKPGTSHPIATASSYVTE